jgi:hypothetical protein
MTEANDSSANAAPGDGAQPGMESVEDLDVVRDDDIRGGSDPQNGLPTGKRM